MEPKILVTGDYWHSDFKHVLSGFDAVTLVPFEKIVDLLDRSMSILWWSHNHAVISIQAN